MTPNPSAPDKERFTHSWATQADFRAETERQARTDLNEALICANDELEKLRATEKKFGVLTLEQKKQLYRFRLVREIICDVLYLKRLQEREIDQAYYDAAVKNLLQYAKDTENYRKTNNLLEAL